MRYEGNIFRPPSEARSYLLQCTIGCSHNKCTFCSMYKNKKYRVRPLEEIKADIRMAKLYHGSLNKVFLCDGDALIIETKDLLEIIDYLYKNFSTIKHLGIYASPSSILAKRDDELLELKKAGLTIAYLGVETGDPQLLEDINKGVTYDEMLSAGLKIKKSGIKLSVTVLLGIAGRTAQALDHAVNTAKILNQMNPDFIGALTLMLEPGTVLYNRMNRGEFELPKPFEILHEMRILIENLELDGSEFRSNHASNYLPIKGRFPEDKEQIIKLIDSIIESKDVKFLRPDYLRAL